MLRKTLTILSLIGLLLSLWLWGMSYLMHLFVGQGHFVDPLMSVGIHLWMPPATFALLLVCCRLLMPSRRRTPKNHDPRAKWYRAVRFERFEEGVGKLKDFEKRMMDWLLDGDDPTLEILRQQFADVNITEREDTGVGIFVRFSVPPETERLTEPRTFQITDVTAEVEGIASGVSFYLFVVDGVLAFLEAGVNGPDEPWPEDVHISRLWYYREKTPREHELSDTRDLAVMRRSFATARNSDRA